MKKIEQLPLNSTKQVAGGSNQPTDTLPTLKDYLKKTKNL